MHLIDQVVDVVASKLIKGYKYDFQEDPLKIINQYSNRLNQIKTIYKNAGYWHGTGRYHYKFVGDSKYDGRIGTNKEDVLKSIINHGGLIPQHDFWTKLNSISLTKNRIYARAYSEFHQYESEPLGYVYGTTRFWFYVLGMKQVFTNAFLHNIRSIWNMQKSKDFNRKFRQWSKYVRKEKSGKTISLLSFYKLRSDIKGNYGILFGIKKAAVKEKKYNSTIERFETRSIKPITFRDMTHIEVPLKNVFETQKILEQNRIKLLILPIELTEIYCNFLKYKTLSC